MLKNLFGKKELLLFSPVDGEVIPLSSVSDEVFASKMMGDGIAFKNSGNIVAAPCDAKVAMIAETNHAIGLTLNNGVELLIHIGLDTVDLQGEGFLRLVSVGEKIKKGTALIQLDLDNPKIKLADLTTPMIITNTSDYELSIIQENGSVILSETTVATLK